MTVSCEPTLDKAINGTIKQWERGAGQDFIVDDVAQPSATGKAGK